MTTRSEQGRAVLVTGASTGIGRACALDLVQRGFFVYAGVRNQSHGEQLQQSAGRSLKPLLLDVTSADQIGLAASTISSDVGDRGLWGLVNNAGILVATPLEFATIEQLRRQFEVNVFGTLAITQAVLPMIRVAAGRIVTIGSITGRAAPPFFGPYAATKHALEGITDSLRMELRRWRISVSIVEPDNVATPIWAKLTDRPKDQDAQLSAEAQALYGDDFAAMLRASEAMDRGGMPVERVARVVHHALTARRPRTRYPVGFRSRLAAWAVCRIPDRIRDWYMLRELKLPQR